MDAWGTVMVILLQICMLCVHVPDISGVQHSLWTVCRQLHSGFNKSRWCTHPSEYLLFLLQRNVEKKVSKLEAYRGNKYMYVCEGDGSVKRNEKKKWKKAEA